MVMLVNINLQSICHIVKRYIFFVFSSSFSEFILTHFWLTDH